MAQGSTQYRSRTRAPRPAPTSRRRPPISSRRWRDKATDQFGKVADTVENVATRVAEQGREAGQQVQEVAGNIKGAVDKSVKDQPMATLALVAALGFVLGALWKS